MMKRLIFCLGLALLAAACAKRGAIDDRREITELRRELRQLFLAGDYAALEARAEGYRGGNAALTEGEPKLRVFYNVFAEADSKWDPELYWTDGLQRISAWSQASPQSLTAALAEAACRIGYAQRLDLDADGQIQLAAGFQALERAAGLGAAKDPHYFYLKLTLGTLHGGVDLDAVFAEAIKAWPDYFPLVIARAWTKQAQWGAAPDALASFLQEQSAVDPERGARILFAVTRTLRTDSAQPRLQPHFSSTETSAFDGLARKCVQTAQRRHKKSVVMANRIALLALKCGWWDVLKDQLQVIGEREDATIWHRNDSNGYSEFRNAHEVLELPPELRR